MTHPTSTTHHFGLYYSVNFVVLHGQYSNVVKSTTKPNRFKYNCQEWFPQQLLKTLRIEKFKFSQNFLEFSQNSMSEFFSINIQETILWEEIQYERTILWNLSEKGKGFRSGSIDWSVSSSDGPRPGSSPVKILHLELERLISSSESSSNKPALNIL